MITAGTILVDKETTKRLKKSAELFKNIEVDVNKIAEDVKNAFKKEKDVNMPKFVEGTKKVYVNKKVAEAIRSRLSEEVDKSNIIRCASKNQYMTPLHKCLNESNLALETLFYALYYGFEVEEKVYTDKDLSTNMKIVITYLLGTEVVDFMYVEDYKVYISIHKNTNGIIYTNQYTKEQIVLALNSGNWELVE